MTLATQTLEVLADLPHLCALGVRVEDGQQNEMLSMIARMTRLTCLEMDFAKVTSYYFKLLFSGRTQYEIFKQFMSSCCKRATPHFAFACDSRQAPSITALLISMISS